jgi:hypothetical protein
LVGRRASQIKYLVLADNRQFIVTVDHRFALSNPALVSAFS